MNSHTAGPTRLRIDSGGDQFPVSGPTPRLSWTPPADQQVTGYQLTASVDGVGQPTASCRDHVYVSWPWTPLRSTQQVTWRVRALTVDGAGSWSEGHRFEAGLFDGDWTAAWITPFESDDPGYGRRPAHLLAASWELPAMVVSARLYATALGVYEAFVNGRRAGTAVLSPGATSYDRTLYAQASDVLATLLPGENRLEILLSDGWYRGQVGAFRRPAGWGTTLAAKAELHLRLADGTTHIVATDHAWTSSPSAITRADLMGGQTTDHTAPTGSANPVRVGAVDGPPIRWSPAPPVRVIEQRAAVDLRQVGDRSWVADFGQNASGWVRLGDLGPAGCRTTLDFGEFVGADGDLDTTHLDSSERGRESIRFVQTDEVVSDGSHAAFEPGHTIHGFRYARITRDTQPDPASLTMAVVHSDLDPTGTFTCSDPDLNRLWDVARWSLRGNAVDIPTDCPTRERLGWTGDYQIFISTATRMYDVLGFSRKWLTSVRDDQLPDGRIANFSPDGRRIKLNLDDQLAMMTGSAGWGDAIVHVPWELHRAYADPLVLAENYDAMIAWVEWALTTAATARHPSRVESSAVPEPHERYLWDGSFHWGEWAEPKPKAADGTPIDSMQTDPLSWFMADKGEVGTAYLYRSTHTLSRIATLLGRTEDAAHYAGVAEQVRQAWRAEFLDDRGRTRSDNQAGYTRALSFDLIPGHLRAAAAARLVALVQQAGNHLTTGFLSTADLLPVLADAGHAAVAYDLLFQRTQPSWLGMLDRGATTIWEDWDGIDANGRAHDSLNHYSKGAVVRFLHSHVLGLHQTDDSAGWRHFRVQPQPHPLLTWARGHLDTPRGRIGIQWRIDGEELQLSVDVPAGATAQLVFPSGYALDVGPGHHEVT